MKRKTTFLIGAAVIALVFVVYVALEGLPPSDDNVAGTMADTTIAGVQKAERYRAEQMTAADVSLDDQGIQSLLQSDVVQRMIESGDFAKLQAFALQDLEKMQAFAASGGDMAKLQSFAASGGDMEKMEAFAKEVDFAKLQAFAASGGDMAKLQALARMDRVQ